MSKNAPAHLKVVRVFIGSPGDLVIERIKFHDVIEELNQSVAEEHGVLLKAIGWEDTLPGRGRPQEKINKDLETCELVVGVLWKRWGTPTGKYSSGFKEEFELSHDAHKEIWLYFKDIPDEMLADPGDQLIQVIAFRDCIEQSREYLYHRFEDEADFEKQLRIHLSHWLQDIEPPKVQPLASSEPDARILELEQKVEEAQSQQEQMALDWAHEAENHANEGRLTKAEECFARAMTNTNYPHAANLYASFLRRIGSLAKAEEIWMGMLESAKQSDDRVWEAAASGNLGLVYATRGDLIKAEEMRQQALTIDKELSHKEGMASQYGNLGLVFQTRGELEKAEKMYKKALVLDQELDRKGDVANNFSSLGVVCQTRGELDKAEEMHEQALALHKELSNKEGLAHDYGNLGLVYATRGDLYKAEEMYQQALALNEDLGREEGKANQYGNLGLVYQKRGDLANSENHLSKALLLFKEIGAKLKIKQTEDNLKIIREQMKKP